MDEAASYSPLGLSLVGAPFPSSHPAKEPTVGSPARPWSFPRAAREEGEEICTCRRPATTRSGGGRRRPVLKAAGDDPPAAASAPDLLAAAAPDLLVHGAGGDPPGAHPWGAGGEPLAAAPLGVGDRRRSNPWPHPWGSAHPSGGHAHGGRRTRFAVAAWAPARSPWPHPWDLGRGAAALCEREASRVGRERVGEGGWNRRRMWLKYV
jgi:hypothetical protein